MEGVDLLIFKFAAPQYFHLAYSGGQGGEFGVIFQEFSALAHQFDQPRDFTFFANGFAQAALEVGHVVGFVFVVIEGDDDHALQLLRAFFVTAVQEILFHDLADVGEVDLFVQRVGQQLADERFKRIGGVEQWIEALQILQFQIASVARVLVGTEGQVEVPGDRLKASVAVFEQIVIDAAVAGVAAEIDQHIVQRQHPQGVIHRQRLLDFSGFAVQHPGQFLQPGPAFARGHLIIAFVTVQVLFILQGAENILPAGRRCFRFVVYPGFEKRIATGSKMRRNKLLINAFHVHEDTDVLVVHV